MNAYSIKQCLSNRSLFLKRGLGEFGFLEPVGLSYLEREGGGATASSNRIHLTVLSQCHCIYSKCTVYHGIESR